MIGPRAKNMPAAHGPKLVILGRDGILNEFREEIDRLSREPSHE